MKTEKTTAQEMDNTSWHPAFLEAIKAELEQYSDILEFTPEYQLTKEPLRIDVVIVKKLKNIPIKKSIAAIFRKYNLIEYKSPSDYISIEDFYKVHAYACLYVIVEPRTAADIAELTITFVGSHYPRKLVGHLVEVHHYTVEKTSMGVYSVTGGLIPIQIIDTRELPEDENIWLGKLDNRLDRNGARKIIDAIDRLDKAARMGAYVDAIYNANFELMEEVSKMSDMAATLNKTLENAGYVTRKMILAGIQAKEEKAREIAQNLISRGFDMKETAEITGMDIEKVRALSEQ